MNATVLGEWFAAPPKDFPCSLLERSPLDESPRDKLSTWAMAALLLLWFVPRALMALKLNTICRDGVFYIHLAQDLDRGQFHRALELYHFNLYPTLLMLLHRVGFDWEIAGRWLGVCMSTLLVVPLFGWLRQHFDRRIAVLTCVLLGVHPKLIEWSPEVIREPLFWFLFFAALYLIWSAVLMPRWWKFAAAGLMTTLAIQTRFEGWILLIPALAWPVWRGFRLPSLRGRLAGGTLLSLAMCPLFILVLNVTWLRNYDRWELGNFERLEYVQLWVESFATADEPASPPAVPSTAPPRVAQATPARPAPQAARKSTPVLVAAPLPPAKPLPGVDPQPTHRVMWSFVHTMERGLHPIYALLLLYGLFMWRHLWFRPNIAVFWGISLAHLTAIWIFLWFAHDSSSRYALLIMLLASPWATLGALDLSRRLELLIGLRGFARVTPGRAAAVFCGVIVIVGLADALTKNVTKRRAVAELGTWIQAEYGPRQLILGSPEIAVIAPFYANSRFVPLQATASESDVKQLIEQKHPDLLVVPRHRQQQEQIAALAAWRDSHELEPIDPRRLPEAFRDHWQIVRLHRPPQVAGQRNDASRGKR